MFPKDKAGAIPTDKINGIIAIMKILLNPPTI
jgi:hypothetical protein